LDKALEQVELATANILLQLKTLPEKEKYNNEV
jgi:hypothetical protein